MLLVGLTGCISYTYTDAKGVEHVIGFVDVAISPSSTGAPVGHAVSVTSLGIAAYTQPGESRGLVMGYARQTTLALKDNACIDLKTIGPCADEPRQAAVQPTEGDKKP